MVTTPSISPLVIAQRKSRNTLIAAACVIAVAALWSLWPMSRLDAEEPFDTAHDASSGDLAEHHSPLFAINDAAFQAPLWSVPPAPVVKNEPPAPPPPPPLKLQLIGIMTTPSVAHRAQHASAMTYSAVLYDPDTDRTITVKEGDVVGTRRVERIEAQRVMFVLGDLRQSLSLDGMSADKTKGRGSGPVGSGAGAGGGQ